MADTAPVEPLGLAEVKTNLKIDASMTDDDALIEGLITAARMHVENFTGLVLLPRTVTETAEQLGRWIDLSSWPVTGITAVRYPLAGVMITLPDGAWLVSYARRPVRLLPAVIGWGVSPTCGEALPVEIDVIAGYTSAADVPQPVKQAMHLLIAHWYGNRQASEVGARAAAVEIPFGVAVLLQPYRLVRV